MEFLNINLTSLSLLKLQTNDREPRHLIKTCRKSGYQACDPDGKSTWRGLGGSSKVDKTEFGLKKADDDEEELEGDSSVPDLVRLCGLLDKLSEQSWRITASVVFGAANDNASTAFLRLVYSVNAPLNDIDFLSYMTRIESLASYPRPEASMDSFSMMITRDSS